MRGIPPCCGQRGQATVEYGLVLFFVVLVGLVGLMLYANTLLDMWSEVVDRIVAAT